ncbi:MAG: DUF192 domain-containing protein [Sphingomonadaceae bacterium]
MLRRGAWAGLPALRFDGVRALVLVRVAPTILAVMALVAIVATGCASTSADPNPPAATTAAGKPSISTPAVAGGTPAATSVVPVGAAATPTVARTTPTVPVASLADSTPGPTAADPVGGATPTAARAGSGLAVSSARITTASGRQVQVRLEVADTPESRAMGLSRRPSLAEDAGMLFVFPSDGVAAFWMKDTLVPLSIAFISADGRILEIQDMERLSEELHRPAQPYRYALEVNQGFFDKNGIKAGDRVEFQLGGR